MERARLARVLAIAACSALGVGALGLTNPPEEQHAPVKAPPLKLTPKSPRPEAKEASPAKTESAKGKNEGAPAKDEHTEEEAGASSHEDPAHAEPAKAVTKAPATQGAPAGNAEHVPDADEALKMLREGNERWVNNQAQAPNTDSARREETSAGQHPFATVLTCADSRLPVERIFDRGVGDVFVVRVAGNVMSPEVAGTIEYGAEHLHVPVLVVMGHTKCGAVAAAASGAHVEGNVSSLVERIAPAVSRAKQQDPTLGANELASLAVRENVWQGIFDLLRTSKEARHLVQEGKLKVVGAVCDVTTGKVEWLGGHPWQDALVEAFETKSAPKESGPATAEVSTEH